MSNATAQCTSVNNSLFMFVTGLASAAIQILFLREYLSIFSGNEMVIGVIFSLWLLATAAGSYAGSRLPCWSNKFPFVYIVSVILGILVIRAARLFFDPGEIIAPWYILLIVLLTQSDAAFFGGLVFGWLSRAGKGPKLYLMENGGSALGLLALAFCIEAHVPNGYMLAIVLTLFAITVFYQSKQLILTLAVCTGFVLINPLSIQWKYPQKIDHIQNGTQGEVAVMHDSEGTTTFIDGTVYRTNIPLPSIEQAVHLPAVMHDGHIRKALLIGNQGQLTQLKKYTDLQVDCFETEQLLTAGGCTCGTVETLRNSEPYDLILIGSGLPSSDATGRFYTREFFRKIRTLTGENGVFSFTLPLSGNYLSSQEKKLKDLLQTTLLQTFHNVMVIPGEGYTFVASDRKLSWPVKPLVATSFLEMYTLASLTPGRINQAAARIDSLRINTIEKPRALLLAQKQWLGLFGIPFLFFCVTLAVLLLIAFPFLPRTKAAQSISTSGFTTGVYSVALMLIYQFTYGTLYSRVALLMIALTAGFVLGCRVKKFPFSDCIIGIYAVITLILLVTIHYPPLALFLVLHCGIGLLSGAQFVTRINSSWSGLYAADLTGGVLGMALCSTVLVPVFGIITVAAGLCVLKLFSAVIAQSTSRSALKLSDTN